MNFFQFFKGKTPLQHEQKGDRYFTSRAWGKAKLEYDTAIEKLEREPYPSKERAERLKEKLRDSKENLSRQHCLSGDDLYEAGYVDEAREYYLLGLELTNDEQYRSVLQNRLGKTDRPASSEMGPPASQDIPEPGEVIEQQDVMVDEDTYFAALCNTLPVEIRRIYKSYGEPFRNGYMALNRGDFQEAAEALTRAQEEHSSSDSYIALELATAYVNLEKYDVARSLLEPFLRRHPDALPAYRLLCDILWEYGEYDRAEQLLVSVPEGLRDSQAYILLQGESMYRQKRYSEAIEWYRTALNTYGWNEYFTRALAVTLESANQPEPARHLYAQIIRRCSRCAPPSAFAAQIDPFTRRRYAELSLAAGDHSTEILEHFLSLVRDDPVNAPTYYRKISRIYSDRGDKIEATRFQRFAEKITLPGPDDEIRR
jgi:tetratricopeptide (TPR) repeat protein